MSAKKNIKIALTRSAVGALWASKLWALLNALLAFFYRCKFVASAHVPFSVKLIGIRNISIGRNSSIGSRSWLNVNDRRPDKISIAIGDNCIIGQENFFTAGDSIKIGSYCLTAKNCSFIGSAHCYDDPYIPYSCSGTKGQDNIVIGVNCFFGYGAQVLGNVTIGHGCVIGAGAVVKGDIPPFSLVVGNPAQVVKRYDFSSKRWVRFPSQEDICEGPLESDYLKSLEARYGYVLQPISVISGLFNDIR